MSDITEPTTDLDSIVAIALAAMPAPLHDLAEQLALAGVKPHQIPALFRQAQEAGHVIICEKGIYTSETTASAEALFTAEHRRLSHAATLLATTNGQFPDPLVAQAAELMRAKVAQLEGQAKAARKLARIDQQIRQKEEQRALLRAQLAS